MMEDISNSVSDRQWAKLIAHVLWSWWLTVNLTELVSNRERGAVWCVSCEH